MEKNFYFLKMKNAKIVEVFFFTDYKKSVKFSLKIFLPTFLT